MSNSQEELLRIQIARCKERLEGEYMLNKKAYQKLISLCGLGDALFDKLDADGDEIYSDVNPEAHHGAIVIYADELVFHNGRSHEFFTSIKDADFLSFSKAKNGKLQIRFGVNDLWKKVD